MPFQKGRGKTGGRTPGTPNKVTIELNELGYAPAKLPGTIKLARTVAERLQELGHDPIQRMIAIAEDVSNPIEIRAKMEAELSKYIYPQRKSVEHRNEDGSLVSANFQVVLINNGRIEPADSDTVPGVSRLSLPQGEV